MKIFIIILLSLILLNFISSIILKYSLHVRFLHNSLPFYISKEKLPLNKSIKFKFTESNKYIFNDEDQFDFNKLFGFKGLYFTPRFNTVMVGWRWNPDLNKFQVLPYFHIGSRNYDFNVSNILNLEPNEECEAIFKIEDKFVSLTLKTCNNEIAENRFFTKSYSNFWFIMPWFGGSKASPKFMKIYFK